MPFFLAASAVIALLAGARSGWRTDAQLKAGETGVYPKVQGFVGKKWVTWIVAWQGQKIHVGPRLVDMTRVTAIENAMRALRPGARVLRFALDR